MTTTEPVSPPAVTTHYAIYVDTPDFPGRHVLVLLFTFGDGLQLCDPNPSAVCGSLAEARSFVPTGRKLVPREPADDPALVELWI